MLALKRHYRNMVICCHHRLVSALRATIHGGKYPQVADFGLSHCNMIMQRSERLEPIQNGRPCVSTRTRVFSAAKEILVL
jgi:hypothetical protein